MYSITRRFRLDADCMLSISYLLPSYQYLIFFIRHDDVYLSGYVRLFLFPPHPPTQKEKYSKLLDLNTLNTTMNPPCSVFLTSVSSQLYRKNIRPWVITPGFRSIMAEQGHSSFSINKVKNTETEYRNPCLKFFDYLY
jgi:hypothetical protein